MMKTTIKQIKLIFKDNGVNSRQIKHNLKASKLASNELMLISNIDNANDIIKLVYFNEPIKKLWTHSYGFQTRQGREISNKFKELYYMYI